MQKILTIGLLLAWTLSIDGVSCLTVTDTPIGCGAPQAVTRVVSYTIRDGAAVIETGAIQAPIGMTNEAVIEGLQHRGHQKKYRPPIAPPVTPGTVIPIP